MASKIFINYRRGEDPGSTQALYQQLEDQFASEDNMMSMATKLTMPVLAVGGEKSFGANEAGVMRNAAVTELVIPNSGHWLMEEQPAATISAIRAFLSSK
jgi:pimeloyl-ACP methyl ester carboxylesterase